MKYKNSFFKLDIRDDGTYMVVYPPISDGKALDVKEVLSFLEDKKCFDYELSDIKALLEGLSGEKAEMKVSNAKIEPFSESAVVRVSPDRMVAYIRFYPPSTGGSVMDKREVLGELEREKITHGISNKVIDVFLLARQYCLNIPIAKGTKPVLAKDASIEYFFNTRPLAKPAVLEDGSVDFHSLNLFTKVAEGDLLARLTPHVAGVAGTDVYGKTVPTNKPKVLYLKAGRNIRYSEDKTEIYSEINGDVSLTDSTVFVSDTYTVAADVDTSTGDIDYDGSVLINGTVRTGFSVKAKGNIQVNGVVESAKLVAGGNIVIKRGVQGMGKGEMEAGGDICAQFFESASVKAGGNVIAGSILHSNVESGGKVVVSGKKGFIVGGEVACDKFVEAHSIGNKMETQTMIKVAVNPGLMDEIKECVTQINEVSPEIEELNSYLGVYKSKLAKGATLSPENIKQIKTYKARVDELEKIREEKNNLLEKLKEKLEASKKSSVRITGSIYRGVTMCISTQVFNVKEKDNHCMYRIVDGDIAATPF
ncbi:MAG: FapA family protein [Clostridium sp.]|nr:FapA family protein [Clostridium sp.]MCM1397979.1 FapA family protein [Clostridium sp.]MCM1459385.1 FapA family protein [Bacteroides sp.]